MRDLFSAHTETHFRMCPHRREGLSDEEGKHGEMQQNAKDEEKALRAEVLMCAAVGVAQGDAGWKSWKWDAEGLLGKVKGRMENRTWRMGGKRKFGRR